MNLPVRLVDQTIDKELANLRALARLEQPGLRALQEWVERKCREGVLLSDRLDIDTLGEQDLPRWIEQGLEELIDEASEALMKAVGEALSRKRLEEVREDIMANLQAECNSRQKLPPLAASPEGPSTSSSPRRRGQAPEAMLVETGNVLIDSRDFWVKIVEFLQQNWALIEPTQAAGVTVYFVGDTSGVFDEIALPSATEAVASLRRNGFRRYADKTAIVSPPAASTIPPTPPSERSDLFFRALLAVLIGDQRRRCSAERDALQSPVGTDSFASGSKRTQAACPSPWRSARASGSKA